MKATRTSLIIVVLTLLVLPGCASKVTQSPQAIKPEIRALRNVTAEVTPQAELKIAGDVEFKIDTLVAALREALKSSGLVAPDGDYDLKVAIKDVRVRSTGSAVMLGFLAGDDHLVGDAIVLNRNGDVVYTFEAEASYALGGFAGGQDSTRMNWLYEKFSDLVSEELVAKRDEKE